MLKFLNRLILQYITCKHKKYIVLRKIYTGSTKYTFPVYFDKRQCKNCNRIYYSDYYILDHKKVIYIDFK